MYRRQILLIPILTMVFLTINYSPSQAKPQLIVLSGLAKVTENIDPGTCIKPDRMMICWNRTSVFEVVTNDSRLTGEVQLSFKTIRTKAPHSEKLNGEFKLDNNYGSWRGTLNGYTNPQGYTIYFAVGEGIDAYDGLIIKWQMRRSDSNWWTPLTVSGTIENKQFPNNKR